MLFEYKKHEALAICSLIPVLFVGSFYIIPKKIKSQDRNNSQHIFARLAWYYSNSFLHSSLGVCLLVTLFILRTSKDTDLVLSHFLKWFGLLNPGLNVFFLFIALFLGPCVTNFYSYKEELSRNKEINFVDTVETLFPNIDIQTWQRCLRNLLWAPVVEEYLFRVCFSIFLLGAGFSNLQIIFIGPLLFGLSHLNHYFEHKRNGFTAEQAKKLVFGQFLYTTLFGALVFYFYLHTRSLLGISLAHFWCNLLGVPDLSFLDETDQNYKHKTSIQVAYTTGILIFLYGAVYLL
eukprot:maker-scaffold_2-snap-gene-25.59-mRNA-1 protein AED:0.02 eAED:0.02 QI:0/0.5/0.33/1/1/1/3/498/290